MLRIDSIHCGLTTILTTEQSRGGDNMKAILVIVAIAILNTLSAQTLTTYYVNIDNAPNGSAEGTITAYVYGSEWISYTKTLIFIENYLGGAGGKYMATNLPRANATTSYIVRCEAYKMHGPEKRWGSSEQQYVGQSSPPFWLPTIHIEDPPTPPYWPPDPK